jgi:hypothetical protein
MKHTPAPWCVGSIEAKSYTGYPGEKFEATIHVGDKSNYGNCLAVVYMGGNGAISNSMDNIEANAYRIVACVNACEGIPTDALECQSKKQITPTMIGLIEEMALLLKSAIARVELANKDVDPILSAWRESAEVAVSKAGEFIPNLAEK